MGCHKSGLAKNPSPYLTLKLQPQSHYSASMNFGIMILYLPEDSIVTGLTTGPMKINLLCLSPPPEGDEANERSLNGGFNSFDPCIHFQNFSASPLSLKCLIMLKYNFSPLKDLGNKRSHLHCHLMVGSQWGSNATRTRHFF